MRQMPVYCCLTPGWRAGGCSTADRPGRNGLVSSVPGFVGRDQQTCASACCAGVALFVLYATLLCTQQAPLAAAADRHRLDASWDST